MKKEDLWPLGGIGFILVVTAAWWSLALWSVPGAPEWLERTRSVCFNITETGLPDAKGWLLLLGQPPAMLAFLLVGWFDEVRASVRRLGREPAGRALAGAVLALAGAGALLAASTVRAATVPALELGLDEPAPETYPRLDRPWPEAAGLVDHTGASFDPSSLGGRAALVTFAFGNCATVCPAVVHQARAARAESERDLSIVVFTLDPWRDTPGRLGAILTRFELDAAGDYVVGGPVDAVQGSLDAWAIPRSRDPRSGDIAHPALVYLVEPDGTIAYASSGGVTQMASLARRLR